MNKKNGDIQSLHDILESPENSPASPVQHAQAKICQDIVSDVLNTLLREGFVSRPQAERTRDRLVRIVAGKLSAVR